MQELSCSGKLLHTTGSNGTSSAPIGASLRFTLNSCNRHCRDDYDTARNTFMFLCTPSDHPEKLDFPVGKVRLP